MWVRAAGGVSGRGVGSPGGSEGGGEEETAEERSEWSIEVTGCCRSSGTLEDR